MIGAPFRDPAEITVDHLRARTLSDLVGLADREGIGVVETWLGAAIDVTAEVLADHEKPLERLPTPVYDHSGSGLRYDPFHDRGEVVIIGGPRGTLRGGYRVLAAGRGFTQRSLLTVLGKGLLHAYNQHLVDDRFDRLGPGAARATDAEFDLYGDAEMLSLAVDQGLTQPFGLHLAGDPTDQPLREAFIDAWAEWYAELTGINVPVFEAVAYTVSDRIAAADGSPCERMIHGLGIQEPLVSEADTSVITRRGPLSLSRG